MIITGQPALEVGQIILNSFTLNNNNNILNPEWTQDVSE